MGIKSKLKKRKFSHVQIISIGYLLMIGLGTLLLMLPISTSSGESASFMEALFTSTSASCVTGLILQDTGTYWSLFGQIVIITLIQIGGLGFMTIATMFMLFLRKRIGLRRREIMAESIGAFKVRGIVTLSKKIVYGTLIFETIGALLLASRFIPRFGAAKGIYYAIFHSVSAFCNAGFDLMGQEYGEFCSLVNFYNDPVVSITICALITIGGIGFWVWDDICEKKLNIKRYTLHTKIVLVTTAILIVGGTAVIFFLERNATGADMSIGERLLTASFAAITPRTAGFNSVDVAAMSDGSKLVTMLLMFIGGSPGSTAGGIKTTTLVVVTLQTIAGVTHNQYVGVFGRRLDNDSLQKATSVFFTNLFLAMGGALIICATQSSLGLVDILFEVFSAIGTVGMSTGITRSLNTLSCYVIVFLMYLGRVGSISFALALLEKHHRSSVMPPVEKIVIG